MAMVVSNGDKSERVHNIGLIETATGIGFLLGPLWGSVMYHIGGYPMPFACSAALFLITWPYIAYRFYHVRK
jgi:MFS family permease